MYAHLKLYRTNVKVENHSTTLTTAQVQQAFSAKVSYSPEKTYDVVMPRFKTTPGASSYETVLTSGAISELAKSNYTNWNWGRVSIFVPDVATSLDLHFTPSHIIPFSDKEILLLLNETTRWGVAFVQGQTSSGNYECTSRFAFIYSTSGTITAFTNSLSSNAFGLLGYQYVPSANTFHVGFPTYNEDIASFTLTRISYSLDQAQAKYASVRTFSTSLANFYINLYGGGSVDKVAPPESSMGAIVKQDLLSYQLMYDPNFTQTSGRAKFSNMVSAGVVKFPKVTVDSSKLDPYYLNLPNYYEYRNASSNNSFGPQPNYVYQNESWVEFIPEYVKQFICAGTGGTRSPGGGDPGGFLNNSGIDLTPLSGISSIPNPATTNNNTRSYTNAALTNPAMKEWYLPIFTQGGVSTANADPKYFEAWSTGAYSKETDVQISSGDAIVHGAGNIAIPCPAGMMYWQGIDFWTGFGMYVDASSGKQLKISSNVFFHYGTLAISRLNSTRYNDYQSLSFTEITPNQYQVEFYSGGASGDGDTPDPNDYNPNGPTTPEMNPGSFDDTSDKIPLPDAPTISIVDAGLITLFNPTLSQLQALSKYMWSDMTTTTGWFDTARKIFADPMQYFIALNIIPFDVPSGDTITVKLAGLSTGVGMTKAARQFVDFDCGEYALNEYWGSALDYAPSTKIWCFLPFIGSVPLDPDMVMKSTIRIVYRTDILTGAFVAFILANDNVLYHFNGNMATNVPLTGADYSRLVSAIIGAASTIALTAGSAGAAGMAAMGVGAARTGLQAASNGMNQAINTVQTHAASFGASMMHGGTTGIAGDMFRMLQANADELTAAGRNMGRATAGRSAASGALAASGVQAVHNTVNSVMAAKPSIAVSGQMSGCSGLMDIQYPYLIIQRPNQALPENYKHYVGYPSHMLADVQSCRGYTVFEQVELSGIPCTDDELAEINDILKGGFYG